MSTITANIKIDRVFNKKNIAYVNYIEKVDFKSLKKALKNY